MYLWHITEEYQNYQIKYYSFHIMVSQEIMEIDSCLFRQKLYLCNLMLTQDIKLLLRQRQVTEKCVPDAWEVYYIVVWYYPVVIKTLPFGLLHKHTDLSSEINCCKLVQYILWSQHLKECGFIVENVKHSKIEPNLWLDNNEIMKGWDHRVKSSLTLQLQPVTRSALCLNNALISYINQHAIVFILQAFYYR